MRDFYCTTKKAQAWLKAFSAELAALGYETAGWDIWAKWGWPYYSKDHSRCPKGTAQEHVKWNKWRSAFVANWKAREVTDWNLSKWTVNDYYRRGLTPEAAAQAEEDYRNKLRSEQAWRREVEVLQNSGDAIALLYRPEAA